VFILVCGIPHNFTTIKSNNYESEGPGFESPRAHQNENRMNKLFFVACSCGFLLQNSRMSTIAWSKRSECAKLRHASLFYGTFCCKFPVKISSHAPHAAIWRFLMAWINVFCIWPVRLCRMQMSVEHRKSVPQVVIVQNAVCRQWVFTGRFSTCQYLCRLLACPADVKYSVGVIL